MGRHKKRRPKPKPNGRPPKVNRTGKRSGNVVFTQMSPNLHAALQYEAGAIRHNASISWTLCEIVRDWLEGRGSDHPVTVPADPVVRRGRPKRTLIEDPPTVTPASQDASPSL